VRVGAQYHASATFLQGKRASTLCRRLGGNQGQPEQVQKIFPHQGSNPKLSSELLY